MVYYGHIMMLARPPKMILKNTADMQLSGWKWPIESTLWSVFVAPDETFVLLSRYDRKVDRDSMHAAILNETEDILDLAPGYYSKESKHHIRLDHMARIRKSIEKNGTIKGWIAMNSSAEIFWINIYTIELLNKDPQQI